MLSLKDQYFTTEFYQNLTSVTKQNYPELNEKKFHRAITNEHQSLELKERLKLCSRILYEQLPKDYPTALHLILKIAPSFSGFRAMFFPDFVASYGLGHYELSINALQQLTSYSSSEFAIRPFLKDYPTETILKMEEWSHHQSEHIRRLASEGLRPLLPWSFKLTEYLAYPEVSKKLLTNLNNDDSLYVRKSVGNHLNDLTKKHPDFVIDLALSWDSSQTHTPWIIKKGLRTLIKNGDKRVFNFLGYPKPTPIHISSLTTGLDEINIGEETNFSFNIENQSNQEFPVLIDYVIHFVKKSGVANPKVFKLRETKIEANNQLKLSKKLIFKQLSTRTHYSGKHKLEILVNGESKAETFFLLKG